MSEKPEMSSISKTAITARSLQTDRTSRPSLPRESIKHKRAQPRTACGLPAECALRVGLKSGAAKPKWPKPTVRAALRLRPTLRPTATG